MNDDFSIILLAAGKGSRMNSSTKKQFMEVLGRPLIYYPLKVFEESSAKEIVIVTSSGDEDFVRETIVERFGFKKVKTVVKGGSERCFSVYEGLKCVSCGYVLVHDGARCALSPKVVERLMSDTVQFKAAEAAVPSVDTVKIADREGFVGSTPNRSDVWSIQTPQGFETRLLKEAYDLLFERGEEAFEGITDDAMIVERAFPDHRIKLSEGDYSNIKVTIPRDIEQVTKTLSDMGYEAGDF